MTIKSLLTGLLSLSASIAAAQVGETKLSDLAAPKSPGFQLVDIAPTNIEAPTTPKSLVIGVLQSFDGNTSWPQNYSMETSPYLWMKTGGRNVYRFLGLKRTQGGGVKQLPFGGIKFSSISASFISKDLIPDAFSTQQKVFAAGIRSNIIRVYQKKHIDRLNQKINSWATYKSQANEDAQVHCALLPEDDSEAESQCILDYLKTAKDPIGDEVIELVAEKPIFSFDLASAYAVYGIGDSIWETGRAGVWATLASYVPLNYSPDKASTSYLDLLVNGRYLYDGYAKANDGKLIKSSLYDIGGKIGFEFNDVSFACEMMYRYYAQEGIDRQTRTVGILSYKIKEGLYVNGAFGKNFGDSQNLVTLFGINWGIGKERVVLP